MLGWDPNLGSQAWRASTLLKEPTPDPQYYLQALTCIEMIFCHSVWNIWNSNERRPSDLSVRAWADKPVRPGQNAYPGRDNELLDDVMIHSIHNSLLCHATNFKKSSHIDYSIQIVVSKNQTNHFELKWFLEIQISNFLKRHIPVGILHMQWDFSREKKISVFRIQMEGTTNQVERTRFPDLIVTCPKSVSEAIRWHVGIWTHPVETGCCAHISSS